MLHPATELAHVSPVETKQLADIIHAHLRIHRIPRVAPCQIVLNLLGGRLHCHISTLKAEHHGLHTSPFIYNV